MGIALSTFQDSIIMCVCCPLQISFFFRSMSSLFVTVTYDEEKLSVNETSDTDDTFLTNIGDIITQRQIKSYSSVTQKVFYSLLDE